MNHSTPLLFLCFLLAAGCGKKNEPDRNKKPLLTGKRILYVDSYHPGYPANIDTRTAFSNKLVNSGAMIRYRYLYSKQFANQKKHCPRLITIQKTIQTWNPHLILAADDDAMRCLVAPELLRKKTPVVFIGVNWSASEYGIPATNVTGQIEVDRIRPLIKTLKRLARGPRIGFIAANSTPNRKSLQWYKKMGVSFQRIALPSTFLQWKALYRRLQREVDTLVVRNTSSLKGWDNASARAFIHSNTSIPTGSVSSHQTSLVLLSYSKDNREFGEWAAKTTQRILTGTSPVAIPIATNQRTRIRINMRLAKKIGLRIPHDILEAGQIVESSR